MNRRLESAQSEQKSMVTRKIAEFVVETNKDHIPREAIEIAKMAVQDMMGSALAGTREPAAVIVNEYATGQGAHGEATIIGNARKTSAPLAALINGTLGHALDYDDASYSSLGHPSVVLLPAVLALGEVGRLPGDAILTAYILGFEVAAKIGLGLGIDAYNAGWHCTATIGVMGAAAACARLLKLGTPATRQALGIAASLSCGLRQNFGTMTKPLHAGVAAQNGVMSALLAGKGFSADKHIFESAMGYAKIFGPDRDAAGMASALGAPFDIVLNGLSFKPYPSCRFTHPLIDAVRHLTGSYNIDPGKVREVECLIDPIVSRVLIHRRPRTAMEGKFSLEYCVARALLDRDVRLDHFTDRMVSTNDAEDLIKRIRTTHVDIDREAKLGEGGGMPPASVVIRLNDGVELSHTVETPKGDPANPMTAGELTAKFRDCAGRILSPQQINACLELLSDLEALDDIGVLMETVTADPFYEASPDTRD